jgi:hypothetical protein
MTTIYVAIVEDRHTDTEVHLFSTPEKAIAYAHGVLDDNDMSASYVDPDDARMSDKDLAAAGWLFYGCYSTEGDCVWVLPVTVDADEDKE